MTRFLLRGSMPPIVAGALIGLGGTAILMQVMSAVIYRRSPADAAYVAAALILLLLCAAWAAFLPAGRAARVSPGAAIRTD